MVIGNAPCVAIIVWFLGTFLWALSIYGVLTVRPEKPPLVRAIHGSWLVTIVAAQSVPILGSQLVDPFESKEAVASLCLVMWLGGG